MGMPLDLLLAGMLSWNVLRRKESSFVRLMAF